MTHTPPFKSLGSVRFFFCIINLHTATTHYVDQMLRNISI